MSDESPPQRARRRDPSIRFADGQNEQAEGFNLRRSRSGDEDDNNPFAVATGISIPASRTASMQSATLVVPSQHRHQSEMDRAATRTESQYSLQEGYEENQFSGVPFNTEQANGKTLPGVYDSTENFENKKWSPSNDSMSPRDFSNSNVPSLDYNGRDHGIPHSQIQGGSNHDGEHVDEGLFGHVKGAFARFTHNPQNAEPSDSRNSWSDERYPSKGDTLDNFERSQAINDEVEETYLIDEGIRRRRHPQERAAFSRQTSTASQEGVPKREGYRSYQDRRKKEKHVIKYHAEPMEDYQKFVLLFSKALLSFGSPSHRIEAQLNSLAKVFEMEAQFQHTPGIIQVSFGNAEQKSSETCLIKSGVGISLGRIHGVHNIYRQVLHDDMYATEGMKELRRMLKAPPLYGQTIRYALSFITCFLICGVAFGGSLNDMWVAGILGFIVRIMQNVASKSDLSASGSEVFTAALVSFIARAFASFQAQIWCFSAISSAAVISLLPGYLILSGSLDIAGKNQSLGAPKIVSGIMTSLYLGFGLTLGSDVFLFIDRPARRAARHAAKALSNTASTTIQGTYQAYNSSGAGFGNTGNATFTGFFTFVNSTTPIIQNQVQGCFRDPKWPWYLQPMPFWTLFFLVPFFALCGSMNNQQHWATRQMAVMVTIACISFWITRLCNITFGLHNHPDYVSLIGSWIVGILGNGYSRRFGGTAFTAMLTGILLLVPDGLSAAGGLAQTNLGAGQDEYTQSLTLARKMISVIIGILSGVYSSAAIIYLFGKKKNAALVTF